jgi:hypothetical protein
MSNGGTTIRCNLWIQVGADPPQLPTTAPTCTGIDLTLDGINCSWNCNGFSYSGSFTAANGWLSGQGNLGGSNSAGLSISISENATENLGKGSAEVVAERITENDPQSIVGSWIAQSSNPVPPTTMS